MTLDSYVKIFTLSDGWYNVSEFDLDILKAAMFDYFASGKDRLIECTIIEGTSVFVRASQIEAIMISTAESRIKGYEIEKQAKDDRRSFFGFESED